MKKILSFLYLFSICLLQMFLSFENASAVTFDNVESGVKYICSGESNPTLKATLSYRENLSSTKIYKWIVDGTTKSETL